MHNEFTAVFERDGEWFIAYSPEIPGANWQGRSKEEARQSLADAIALILQERREDGLRGVPPRRRPRYRCREMKRSSRGASRWHLAPPAASGVSQLPAERPA
jgi:predicted RNase H-like HicB family nuclease